MAYFDDRKNVDDYIKMAAGYDGRELIAKLKVHLPAGSSVLELGMGPGVDLEILAADYTVTGSDNSKVFLDLYRESHPEADLMTLDAETIETERNFDCVYSNKVLHHLTRDGLCRSFTRQRDILAAGGLIFHSFWHGSKEKIFDGLRFVYYTEDEILRMAGTGFEALEVERYKELEKDDSFYVLLRKPKGNGEPG
jgi:cyclopropane fatty-acyl-phospholipid synthase-like methyltransferase